MPTNGNGKHGGWGAIAPAAVVLLLLGAVGARIMERISVLESLKVEKAEIDARQDVRIEWAMDEIGRLRDEKP